MTKYMIEVKGVSKYFYAGGLFRKGKTVIKALEDVSLGVEEGKILGLVGESGSGKTTLVNTILRLTDATAGTITIDGIDIGKANSRELKKIRSEIAVVFQDPMANLNPRFTVEQSIMRPLLIQKVSIQEARKRAAEVMDMVKMDPTYLKSYPRSLSGGQLQRIAIARALVLRPKIMILDEPTSALDISIQAQVLNMLLAIQEELKITYILITHDLNVVRYISDDIAVMYLGKLMEYGPAEEIFFRPRHPYTQGLMAATPVTDPRLRRDRPLLFSGEPGSLINRKPGCRLEPRCPYAGECCKTTEPEFHKITESHFSACHLEKTNE